MDEVPRTDLAERLADFARSLGAPRALDETVQILVDSGARAIPGAESVGVSVLTRRNHIEAYAVTDALVEKIDALQNEVGEGPCLETSQRALVTSVPDLERDTRWPRFTPGALRLGVRSTMAFSLYVDDQRLGSLSVFSARPGAFTEESEREGLLFAAHAAVALAAHRRAEHLSRALESRDLIGQAKGILVERHGVTSESAFLALAKASQDSNVKLREVAEQLVREANLRAGGSGWPAPDGRPRGARPG